MKNRPRRKDGKVLGDYRKVGTKFVPPLLDMPTRLDYISWASHIMPELIWWDVLADKVSHRFAAKVAEEIGQYFKGRENRAAGGRSYPTTANSPMRMSTD